MANFIALVYATLKEEGIDTKGMSTDEAVAKFKELKGGESESPDDVKKKLNGEKPQVKPKRVVDEGAKKIHQEREKAKKENINNALEYAKTHNEMSYSIKQKGGEPDIEATIDFATGDIKTKGSNVVRNIYDGGYTNKEKWIKDHFVDTDWKIKYGPETEIYELDESSKEIVDDAIYWAKKKGNLSVQGVFEQLEEDMAGFLGNPKMNKAVEQYVKNILDN